MTLQYIFHALITPVSNLSVNMIVELKKDLLQNIPIMEPGTDGNEICNRTLKSLTVE